MRLRAREAIRDDGFFRERAADEPPAAAEELLEGVLLKAQQTFELKKADRMGDFFPFVASRPDVSPAHANYLIELAGRLTYRQLLLLGFLAEEEVRVHLPDWSSTGSFTRLEMGLVDALLGLARENLLRRDDNAFISGFADINPRRLETTLNGKLLVEGMRLHEAEPDDIRELQGDFAMLGKVAAGETTRMDAVVPPGSPPDLKRVKIDKQAVVVERPVISLDAEDLPDGLRPDA